MTDAPRGDAAKPLAFDAKGFGRCPECQKLIGWLDYAPDRPDRMLLYSGGVWLDYAPRMYCPKCMAQLCYVSTDKIFDSLMGHWRR